jgi:hypothetical protein
MGLAVQAQAQTVVREAPVHAVPIDEDEGPAVAAEPAPVQALAQPRARPAPELTPEENAFFAALGQRVTDAASAYENYVRRAGAIDPAFNGSAAVQRAVKLGAAYHPHQLEEGIVAYAALIALRNPDFVAGVRAIQNPAFADGLADHPERVMQVRGAPAAAADVAGVLRSQGESLIAAGKAVTKAAYDIQAQSWSKSPVSDPRGVLDAAKTSADQTRTATGPSKERLLASLVTTPQSGDASTAPAPDVVRGVALAALAILGRTGDGQEAQFEALLDDPASAQCLKMAKLNLNQCLAVAGPHYEDAYCAGRHAVSDTGKCVTDAAGGNSALDAAPAPRLQTADAIGPEQASVYGKVASRDIDDDEGEAAPASTPALAAAPAPLAAPVPSPRQYAEVAPRADPTPDPRVSAYAQPQAQQPQLQQPQLQQPQPQPSPQAYARNDYASPPAYQQPAYQQQSYPQAQYQPQPQPQYQQQYQQQPYQQPYPQPQYAPQPYPQAYAQNYAPQQPYAQSRPSYAPNYAGQQPYYPQQQQQQYYQGGYYGR